MSTARRLRGLPPAADRRVRAAADSGVWSSNIPVGEEGLLRTVGLVPVGVVTASVVSWPFPYRYPASLAYRSSGQGAGITFGLQRAGPYRGTRGPLDDLSSASRIGGFTRDYLKSSTGGLIGGLGQSWQRVVRETRQRQLFDAAMGQLRTEAGALAAHGIVGVDVAWIPRESLSFAETEVEEVRVTGTAVRATGSRTSSRVFTTVATAAEAAQLLLCGLAPSEAVFGIGVVRADLGSVSAAKLRSLGAGEVEQYSEAVQKSLELAFADLERRAASSGDLVVGCKYHTDFQRRAGAGTDTETSVIGTAVRRFSAPGANPPLRIMKL